jgi:hypothetical protein
MTHPDDRQARVNTAPSPLQVTRRSAVAAMAFGATTGVWAQATSTAPAAPAERDGAGQTLQDLHQAALKEGGTLTVYAGGDEVTQGFGIKSGFERQFPGMKVNIVVDLSKYHDARIEEELLRKDLKVDVAHLQTLHDFDDWAARGLLLPYKPIGWDQVPAAYRIRRRASPASSC